MVSIRRKGDGSYRDLMEKVARDLCLDELLDGARRVLIKPNFVTAKTSAEGVTVNLEVVGHLVEIINETCGAEVVVGETALIDTEEVFRSLGVYGLESYGCRVVNFESDEWVEVAPPAPLLLKRFLTPRTAVDSDVVINVSKMKTHELTGVTLGLKNFFGLLSAGGRRYAHKHDVNRAIVDVYSYYEGTRRMASIIEGLTALSGRSGPIIGTPVQADCLVSSTNTVAADAAGAAIMGAVPSQIEHIRLAAEFSGVDIDAPSEARVLKGQDFELPLLSGDKPFRVNVWLHDKFHKYPIQKDSGLCTDCRRCESICPKGLVAINDRRFSFAASECIHCLCCVEACNSGAIGSKMKNEALFLALRQGWNAMKTVKELKNKASLKRRV